MIVVLTVLGVALICVEVKAYREDIRAISDYWNRFREECGV